MTKRVKKPRLIPSIDPLSCVVLAVDTAAVSGWSVYVKGELWSVGEIDMLRPERSTDSNGVSGWNADRVCMHAVWECADHQDLSVALVFERPFSGTTQGQWIGAWRAAFVANGGQMSKTIGVYPATWRSRVLGGGRMARDQARELERTKAMAVARSDSDAFTVYLGDHPDACASVCIGQWAIRAGEVAAVLPKRARKSA